MPTIAALASATIALAQGDSLFFTTGGAGIALVQAGTTVRSTQDLGGRMVQIGPFDGPRTVVVSAQRALTYFLDEANPTNVEPPPQTVTSTQQAPDTTVIRAGDLEINANALQTLVSGAGNPAADSVLTKYGRQVADIVSPATTVGVTTMTHAPSNERTRFSAFTRKATPSANTMSELRFPNLSMTLDPDDQSLTIPIYIDAQVSEKTQLGALFFIAVNLSQGGGSLGANFSQWQFGASYLRQGWNLLKMRAADSVGGATSGNLPFGLGRAANAGTGVNMAAPITYMSIQMTNMSGVNTYIDNPRRSAKAKTTMVLGFDANGADANDNIFVEKVAPLFARFGFKGYCTFTNIYEAISAGGASWQRLVTLQNQFGWEHVNHTWSHGATEVGREATVTITWTAGTLATVTFSAAHNIPIGKRFKARLIGATPASFNGLQDMTATTTTQVTFPTAEATGGTATGTITLFTYLAEVFYINDAETRRLLAHELTDNALLMRGAGMGKAANFVAYPNNSVPELNALQAVCTEAGIAFGRSTRGGMIFVDEMGIDNPLHFGSFVWDSGSFATTTSFIIAKINAAVERGEPIWLYGHYIQDEATVGGPVDLEYPPGSGGNPPPPGGSLSGTGGWWYLGQLERIFTECIGPHVAAGRIEPMTLSQFAQRMGYGVGK